MSNSQTSFGWLVMAYVYLGVGGGLLSVAIDPGVTRGTMLVAGFAAIWLGTGVYFIATAVLAKSKSDD